MITENSCGNDTLKAADPEKPTNLDLYKELCEICTYTPNRTMQMVLCLAAIDKWEAKLCPRK